MKFTLAWLKDHLDTDASVDEIVAALNRIGLEVEGVENPAEKLQGFKVARVLTAERHPQADKLQVLTVDQGDGVPLQVVCGAPNARAGLVGVLGLPGATVPANGIQLKVSAIRGVESNGMMCSSRELELGDEHDGIIELPADAPVGTPFAYYAGADDPVIDVAITPNRQDCMGVRGIARDLAAAGLGTLKPLILPGTGRGTAGEAGGGGGPGADAATAPLHQPSAGPPPPPGEDLEIRTDDPDGCPAFYGRIIRGVRNGAAPEWMQQRLKAVGQRPISAIVDITNYVMLDHGRPSHAYDLAKLSGPVVARRARDGETALALNGKEYALTPEMTVIADANGVHDIAGIMGGEHSGVTEATTDILLEVAYFTPERIAKTGQALGLASDARARFERGVDPAFLDDAVEIITGLILEHCGGDASDVIRAGEPPAERKVLRYDPALCARLGGLDVPADEQTQILQSLGFTINSEPSIPSEVEGRTESEVRVSTSLDMDGSGEMLVTVPTWRRDIDGPADLVEEVVRVAGIDNVPSTALPRAEGVAKPTATPEQLVERRVRRTAAARGLNEAVTWSFISEREAEPFGGGAWTLANPISEELKVMRPSLLPGLLGAAQRNLDRGAKSVRLFEMGRRYLADAERPTLGVVLAGERIARDWQAGKAQAFTAFDAKAEMLALLEAAGAPVENLQVMGDASAAYHPGQSATLRLGPKTVLAEFGALHPRLAKSFDLDGAVIAGELFLDAIPAKRTSGRMRAAYTPPAFQPLTRDFAFLVPETLAAGDLVRAVRGADKALIASARLFDLFAGAGVPEGQKSLAVEVTLQPTQRTLAEEDLTALSAKVVAAAAKLGATLRG
jgi:phenylalanyl-tRNA synthetase beta chain